VLRDFEEIQNTQEAGRARQLRSDVGEADRLDGIDFDLSVAHPVPFSNLHVRAGPYANAAGDFSATNSVAQTLGKNHGNTLPQQGAAKAHEYVQHLRIREICASAARVR